MEYQRNIIDKIRITLLGLITLTENFLGGYDTLIKSLMFFMCLDYITGIAYSFSYKEISSQISIKGLLKKCGIIVVVSTTAVFENIAFQTSTMRDALILFYISSEGISIIENLCRLGIPIPPKIKEALYISKEHSKLK